MGSTLTVIWWRDIPAQVLVRGGGGTHKVVLPQRFQTAIDRAAGVAGLTGNDAYLAGWRRVPRPCGDDVAAEVAAEAASLDARYTRADLQRLADAGGLDIAGGVAHAPGAPTPNAAGDR